MRRDLERRLEQLEREMHMPTGCQVIRIKGGLPTRDGYATAGSLRFWRKPDESREAFEARVIETADAVGEPFVVFDGFPPED